MIKIYGGTDRGRVRATNQDTYAYKVVDEETAFAIVCDGMGGEKGGHVASAKAAEVIGQALTRGLTPQLPAGSVKSLLISAAAAANAVVYEMGCRDESLDGMGTTVIAVVVKGDLLCAIHAGDSRLYLFENDGENPGAAQRLTRDHSVVQLLIDSGEISEQEARNHPKRNYITRALGVERSTEVEYTERAFRKGQLLLCSDGLYNYAPPEEHAALITTCTSKQDLFLLIDEANKAGGADNITAVIVAK